MKLNCVIRKRIKSSHKRLLDDDEDEPLDDVVHKRSKHFSFAVLVLLYIDKDHNETNIGSYDNGKSGTSWVKHVSLFYKINC